MSTMGDDISILLVEDQTLMRQGLRTLLELEGGLHVVGEAGDGEAGLHEALRLRPDIVLTDVQMPKLSGVELTQALCSAWPQARVIVLTTFDRDDYVYQSIRAGALGYLLKDAPAEQLISTIRRVHAGDVFIQPEIASRALREIAVGNQSAAAPASAPLPFDLSEREREVLVLLAQGASNRQIAERLFITEGTAKNHVSNILGKLQAENRTKAADIARRHGLT
jgi:DNA-binding NarL/FixJ family response regulator